MSRSLLDELLALYRPNVGRGNFMGDVAWRGQNEMLKKVIVKLGVATEDMVHAHFKRLDEESYERTEAAIRKFEAEDAER